MTGQTEAGLPDPAGPAEEPERRWMDAQCDWFVKEFLRRLVAADRAAEDDVGVAPQD